MSNKLQLTHQTLTAAKDLKELLDIPAVRQNAISNRVKTTGKTEEEAEMTYEREKILFHKAVQSNPKLAKCDYFSIYSAWIELHCSGSTLAEGCSYIIPYKDKANFQMGYKGRIEQLSQIPGINFVEQPQVVYKSDLFDYELGDTPRIIKHVPKEGSTEITHVYLYIDTIWGKKLYLMTRAEVLAIRDAYSMPYKMYIKAGGKWQDGNEMEKPFWITSEAEAFKKTCVTRAYKWTPNKTGRMKALDERIKNNPDPEDGSHGQRTEDIDYGLQEEPKNLQAPEVKTETPKVDLGDPSTAF